MYSTKLIMLRICEISLTLAVFVWIQNTNLQVSLSIRGHCNMLTYIEILIFTAILLVYSQGVSAPEKLHDCYTEVIQH